MNVLQDGALVFLDDWQLVISVLILVFIGQRIIRSIFRTIFEDTFSTSEYLSLSIAGWIAPALLVALIWSLLGIDNPILFGLLVLTFILINLPRLKPDPSPASISKSLIFPFAVFAFTLLRLAYVRETVFPSYFDSAQHYLLTKSIMDEGHAWLLKSTINNYYHLGFHFLAAFFASVLDMEITRVMLVLGQMILALIPFSIYFLVRHETRSKVAGWFAIVLSAFGWYMPAHAVDWGKYPAMMSLGLIPFTLGIAYLISKYNNDLPIKERWSLYGMLGISLLLSVFAHSRSVVVLGIVFLAWMISNGWQKFPQRQMLVAFILVVVFTLLEVEYIQRQSILVLLVDPYLQKGTLVTAYVLVLSIFAWMAYPRFTFVIVLTITFLLGSAFIPVTFIPGYRDLTLLDRPFVEMILFMPLSMLGGLGLSGLEKKLQGQLVWSKFVGVFAIGVILVNAFFTHDLYPSDCCVIVGNDDVAAMDWMAKQLPVDARIGIASTELKVMTSDVSEGDIGIDAGIWVTPLTGRMTIPLPNDLEFGQQSTLEKICDLKINYLFVGEKGQPFGVEKIASHPERYKPLLSMPKTRVYEVIGCE